MRLRNAAHLPGAFRTGSSLRSGLLTLAVLIAALPASAQPARTAPEPLPRYRFERLTVADGMPENFVVSLLQDRLGFMWIGTQNGLVRYDGREVKDFKERSSSGRVQIGHVRALIEDGRGGLWAGGNRNSGLWHLDRRTERWTSYEHAAGDPVTLSGNAVRVIEEAAPGRIVAMTGPGGTASYCLDRLDVTTGAVRRFRIRGASASAPEGACINLFPLGPISLRDRRGLVWIGTQGGLLRYDAHADSVTYFQAPSMARYGAARFRALDAVLRSARPLASIEQPGDSVDLTVPFRLQRPTRVLLVGAGEMGIRIRADYGWLEDARGRVVWTMHRDSSVWTGAFGLNRLSVATRLLPAGAYRLRFRSDYDHSPADGFSQRTPEHPELWGVRVVPLAAEGAGAASGLVTGPPPPRRPDEVSGDLPFPLAEDAAGVWLGGFNAGGLTRWEARTGHFRAIHATPDVPGDTLLEWTDVRTLLPGAGGVLWVGTNQGLYRVRGALGPRPTSTRFTFASAPGAPLNVVTDLVAGEGGTLWLATDGGLVHFDAATGRRQVYPVNTTRPDGLGGLVSTPLLQDRQQNLWIGGGSGGLHRLDRTAGRATRLRYDVADAVPFPGGGVISLAQTPDGDTWAVTDSGLVRMKAGTRIATRVTQEGVTYVYRVMVDRAGRLWQAGLAKGSTGRTTIFRLDPRTGRVLERFPRAGEPLLPYGVVPYTLAEGPGGTLWIGTAGVGLMRLDPASGRFHAYPFRRTPRTGVSDSLDYHVATSITTDRSGALWIGTFEGGLNRLDVATGRFTSYFDLRRGVRRVTSIHE
ncbi:MAG TPA: two-component regulator propeller domain-containing protein, partial [Rhodothermales bacterium]|nr:two-component regulator propeller domain-containing protein [Rhodothermales bacterium]